jgi:hypothetical protein
MILSAEAMAGALIHGGGDPRGGVTSVCPRTHVSDAARHLTGERRVLRPGSKKTESRDLSIRQRP